MDKLGQTDFLEKWIPSLSGDVLREYAIIGQQIEALERRSPGKYGRMTLIYNILAYADPFFLPSLREPTGFAPALSVAYHFCRMVDDIADSDAPLPAEHPDFARLIETLKRQTESSASGSSDLEFLLKRTLLKLDRTASQTYDYRAELRIFLDAMETEHDKRVGHKVFTEHELYKLYDDSFGPPHKIAFSALGSDATAELIQDLNQLQGRLYGVRDLIHELNRGIVYIPKEILDKSGLDTEELIRNPEDCLNNTEIHNWIQEEYRYGLEVISRLRASVETMDWKAKGVVGFLTKPIETRIRVQQATQ